MGRSVGSALVDSQAGSSHGKSETFRPRPTQVIEACSGGLATDARELWRFRDLLVSLAIRDVKLRYRQTALGAIWVILQPLLAAGIFTFVFGKLAKFPSHGVPYFVFSYAGLLGWTAFSSTLAKASSSLVANNQLISKVYFPRMILPLSTVFSTLVDFAVALAMMAVMLVATHTFPAAAALTLPLWLALMLALAIGLGLICSALTVYYRDVQYVLPVLTQFLMYASPVGYAVSIVPARVRWLYNLNPLAGLLEGFRWSLLPRYAPPGFSAAYAAAASLCALVLGAAIFRQMQRRMADVI